MKYRIRTALISFFVGWYASAFYYAPPYAAGMQAQAAQPPAPPPVLAPAIPKESHVVCKYEFPPLPIAALEDNNG